MRCAANCTRSVPQSLKVQNRLRSDHCLGLLAAVRGSGRIVVCLGALGVCNANFWPEPDHIAHSVPVTQVELLAAGLESGAPVQRIVEIIGAPDADIARAQLIVDVVDDNPPAGVTEHRGRIALATVRRTDVMSVAVGGAPGSIRAIGDMVPPNNLRTLLRIAADGTADD